MKTIKSQRHACFLIGKSRSRWHAVHPSFESIGGTRTKRDLIDLLEEKYAADVIGNFAWVPKKNLNKKDYGFKNN